MIFDDTIAAIATPIGEGGIGIIRISGPRAKDVGMKLLTTIKGVFLTDLEPRRVYHGLVVDPISRQPVDEALFFYLNRPKSFTGEDTIEIQAHGGTYVLSKILALTLQNGARMGEPGEFTQRAFLNGRINLVQAESIIDLIRAKTEKAHELALTQLTGRTTQRINQVEDALYQMLIAIEATLDFPEEGIPEVEKEKLLSQTDFLYNQLCSLLEGVEEGRKLRDGITLVIVGRPNVGKSSLLNALLQEEKAIVTSIPGTTRDVIEAQFQLRGALIRLIDTAGLREAENIIERIGIAKAEEYINQADLILFILDGSQPLADDDRRVAERIKNHQVLTIINKTDLPQVIQREKLQGLIPGRMIELSLVTKDGLAALEEQIVDLVGIGEIRIDDRPLLSRVRHKHALEQAVDALTEFKTGLSEGKSEDLIAVDLRSCLNALGKITGKNVSNEVIHGIFAQFCIGK